jgi:hypothetical protein
MDEPIEATELNRVFYVEAMETYIQLPLHRPEVANAVESTKAAGLKLIRVFDLIPVLHETENRADRYGIYLTILGLVEQAARDLRLSDNLETTNDRLLKAMVKHLRSIYTYRNQEKGDDDGYEMFCTQLDSDTREVFRRMSNEYRRMFAQEHIPPPQPLY